MAFLIIKISSNNIQCMLTLHCRICMVYTFFSYDRSLLTNISRRLLQIHRPCLYHQITRCKIASVSCQLILSSNAQIANIPNAPICLNTCPDSSCRNNILCCQIHIFRSSYCSRILNRNGIHIHHTRRITHSTLFNGSFRS